MIDLLSNTIGDTGDGKKLVSNIENLHHMLNLDSEGDFPRGAY